MIAEGALAAETPAADSRGDVRAVRLVVNADDLGETQAITHGILDCIDAGAVTSTTILANMPATPLALREAAARGRQASFGVHLNLCEGPSLTRAPSLAPDGVFLAKRVQALRALAGRLDRRELEAEMRAQITRVLEAGVQVSHLDGHKHLHQLPGAAEATIGLAREFGIERVRCTLETRAWAGGGTVAALSARARGRLAGRFRRRLAEERLRHPGRTFDLAQLLALPEDGRLELLRGDARPSRGGPGGFPTGSAPAAGGSRAIGAPGAALHHAPSPPVEMVCHPGRREADLEKPGSRLRFVEYGFLRSERFMATLDLAGVRLASYWEV